MIDIEEVALRLYYQISFLAGSYTGRLRTFGKNLTSYSNIFYKYIHLLKIKIVYE